MRKRTGAVAVALALPLAGLVVVSWMAIGRLPLWVQALQTMAASLSTSSTSLAPSATPSPTGDAALPPKDAGTTPRRQTGPLSSAQLGVPLVHGPFVSACGAPDDMKIVVDVTVKLGRAVGVGVKTHPPSAAVASCVERAIRSLQWDVSPKTDRVTVTY